MFVLSGLRQIIVREVHEEYDKILHDLIYIPAWGLSLEPELESCLVLVHFYVQPLTSYLTDNKLFPFQLMDQNLEDDSFFASTNGLVTKPPTKSYNISNVITIADFQSDSTFVPIKTHSTETISGTESDESSIRSVRFSKLAEVREMSPHEAGEALMSRLSYSASIRVRRQKTNHKTARTALMFCVLVSIVCIRISVRCSV